MFHIVHSPSLRCWFHWNRYFALEWLAKGSAIETWPWTNTDIKPINHSIGLRFVGWILMSEPDFLSEAVPGNFKIATCARVVQVGSDVYYVRCPSKHVVSVNCLQLISPVRLLSTNIRSTRFILSSMFMLGGICADTLWMDLENCLKWIYELTTQTLSCRRLMLKKHWYAFEWLKCKGSYSCGSPMMPAFRICLFVCEFCRQRVCWCLQGGA